MAQAFEIEEHVLYVPPEGPVEVLHSSYPIDDIAFLRSRGVEASTVRLPIIKDGEPICVVVFGHGEEENARVRKAIAHLTGVHVVFTGHAMIYGLNPEEIADVVTAIEGQNSDH